MKTTHIACLFTLALSPCAPALFGQVSITAGNLTYAQDFNLPGSQNGASKPVTWTDNEKVAFTDNASVAQEKAMAGWYTAVSAPVVAGANGTYQTGSGQAGSTSTGSFQSVNFAYSTSNENALVLRNTASSSSAMGVVFSNNSGNSISSFKVEYDGEQYRRENNASSVKLDFQYKIITSLVGFNVLTDSSWSDVNTLDFTSPITGATSASNLTGTSSNQVAGITDSISLTLLEGELLAIRWFYDAPGGAGHAIGIDDLSVTFTAIPEPSTYAALFGALSLGAAVVRRRRSRTTQPLPV